MSPESAAWFDGMNLDGWLYDPDYWRVENGEIIASAPDGIPHNTWATGPLHFKDFRMIVEVKLVDDAGNSGIQFRSSRALDGEVSGLQADIGPGWWGKLYEEHGRGLLEARLRCLMQLNVLRSSSSGNPGSRK